MSQKFLLQGEKLGGHQELDYKKSNKRQYRKVVFTLKSMVVSSSTRATRGRHLIASILASERISIVILGVFFKGCLRGTLCSESELGQRGELGLGGKIGSSIGGEGGGVGGVIMSAG